MSKLDPYSYQSILDRMVATLPVGLGGPVIRSILKVVAGQQAEMYQLWQNCIIETCGPEELEAQCGLPQCDCGAAKANCTHADWCSTQRN